MADESILLREERMKEKIKEKIRIPIFLGAAFKNSMGPLFAFFLITTFIVKILTNIFEITLNLILQETTEAGFVSSQNFLSLFKSPVAIAICLIFIVILFLIAFFEITAIITCVDNAYQNKTIRFGSIFSTSFKNMRNALKPKNWCAILVNALLFPFSGIFVVSSVITDISLPEYIADDIFNKTGTTILFIAVLIFIVVLAFRLIFANTIFITEHKSWKESVEKSRKTIKGNAVKSFFCVLVRRIFSELVFIDFPMGMCLLVCMLFQWMLKMGSGFETGAVLLLNTYIFPYAVNLFSLFSMVYVIAYIFLLYKQRCEIPEFPAGEWGNEEIVRNKTLRKSRAIAIIYVVLIVSIIIAVITGGRILGKDVSLLARLTPKTDVTAHRGDSEHAPESSAAAFKKAIEDGFTDRIEFDVHPSKDGYAIVMHDSSTERTCGKGGDISDMTLAEIKQLECGSWFADEFSNEKVLTLEELLELTGDFPLLLEIKNHSKQEGFEESIIETLRKYNCIDRVMIHSSSYESVVKAKIAAPEIDCGLIMLFSLGDFQDIPYTDFYSIEHTLISKRDISLAHLYNKKIFAWTVNKEENADWMIRYGIDSIITDNPEMVYEVLENYS